MMVTFEGCIVTRGGYKGIPGEIVMFHFQTWALIPQVSL